MTYLAGDDVTYTRAVVDQNGGTLDVGTAVVAKNFAGDTVAIDAAWNGPAVDLPGRPEGSVATTRDLAVPLAALPSGLWGLYLQITGAEDVFLGNVYIQ